MYYIRLYLFHVQCIFKTAVFNDEIKNVLSDANQLSGGGNRMWKLNKREMNKQD